MCGCYGAKTPEKPKRENGKGPCFHCPEIMPISSQVGGLRARGGGECVRARVCACVWTRIRTCVFATCVFTRRRLRRPLLWVSRQSFDAQRRCRETVPSPQRGLLMCSALFRVPRLPRPSLGCTTPRTIGQSPRGGRSLLPPWSATWVSQLPVVGMCPDLFDSAGSGGCLSGL